MEEALRRDLDVDPASESQNLREQILNGALAPKRLSFEWLLTPQHNLPALVSSFIGREGEAAELRGLARPNRLVTLVGAGGVGKTRLALKVAESLLDEFPDGVYWVELALLSNPSLVAKAVLDVFRLPEKFGHTETDRLADFLSDRHLLILLDNCEHLIAGCASLVGRLLNACPNLHIVVTSRVRLNLPGEITYYVPSLATPDPTQPISLTELAQYDSVRLFTERSGSYSQGFTLTTANASAVAHICERLDGIPLALELAAARSRMMTAEQIADQLNDASRLLVGGSQAVLPRHRTLHASIEWSYNLLSRKERLLLQRLSVFSGGWGVEAAEAVCAGEEIRQADVLDLLGGLVDQSMVIVETFSAGEARYRLLETVRQYTHERLVESDEVTVMHQQHLAYFLQLAEQADLGIRGPQQLVWIKRLEKEHSNLTSALERAFGSPSSVEKGVQLAGVLTWYWGMIGDFTLERYFLGKALSGSADFGRIPARARILFHAGSSSSWGGNLLEPQEAKACIEESLEIWRELGQDYLLEEAQCLLALGYILKAYFNDDEGFALMNESKITFQNIGNTWWHAWALNLISMGYEDPQTVHAILQEEMILWRKAGDRYGQAIPLSDWGMFALKHSDFVEAQVYLQRGLSIFEEFGSKGMAYQVLRDLGQAARALKEYDQAELYYENCVILAQEIGWNMALSVIHRALGFVALHKGDDRRAEKSFNQALRIAQESMLKKERILCLAGFAALRGVWEKPAAATCLFGAFSALLETNELTVDLVDQIDIDQYLELYRAQVDRAVFDQAWNAGRTMTLEQAEAYAQKSVN